MSADKFTKDKPLIDKLIPGPFALKLTEENTGNVKAYLEANPGKQFQNIKELFLHLLQTAGNPGEQQGNQTDKPAVTAETTSKETLETQLLKTILETFSDCVNEGNEPIGNVLARAGTAYGFNNAARKRAIAIMNKHFPDIETTGNGIFTMFDHFDERIEKLKVQASGNQQPATDTTPATDKVDFLTIGFEMLDDERLKGFAAFRTDEHKHPFETLARMKKLADDSIIQYEQLKFALEEKPFYLLEPEEYEFLEKWDRETFMPGMRALTGIDDLRLTARHKFMMMLDYVQADPVGEVLALFPGATPEQKAKLEDMQFPRASVVKQVLEDIEEKKLIPNEAMELVKQSATLETGKVIDINRSATAAGNAENTVTTDTANGANADNQSAGLSEPGED